MSAAAFFDGFRKGMQDFGRPVTAIINTVLLAAVYVLGVGVTAIIARIAGKRFLETAHEPEKGTYWEPCDTGRSPERHHRQF